MFLEHIIGSGTLTFTVLPDGGLQTPLLPSAENLVPFKTSSSSTSSVKVSWFLSHPGMTKGGYTCALVSLSLVHY